MGKHPRKFTGRGKTNIGKVNKALVQHIIGVVRAMPGGDRLARNIIWEVMNEGWSKPDPRAGIFDRYSRWHIWMEKIIAKALA